MPIETSQFNKDHAASIDYVNTAITEAWEKFLLLVTQNIDKLDYIVRIIDKEAEALRITKAADASAYDYAVRLSTAVNAMVVAFSNAGLDMTGITTELFATCIDNLSEVNGCYIKGVSGTLYTPENWAYLKLQLLHDPELHEGIQVTNPDHTFLVASINFSNIQYGTYGHTVPNLDPSEDGVAGRPKNGEKNSRLTLAVTDPDVLLAAGFTKTYYSGMTYLDLLDENVDLVFFPDESTLISWATNEGLSHMASIGTSMVYAIPHTDTGYYVLKYFSGTTSIAFANREAKAPYTDSLAIIGVPALKAAVEHREYTNDPDYGDDPNFWRGGSLFELLVCYLNRDAINRCRVALGTPNLPTAEVWSVVLYNSNSLYYLNLGTGSYSSNFKNGRYCVVPIASSTRPTAD